jgi:hypothetical protein
MAQKFTPLGKTTVTTAGTRVRLTTSDTPASSVIIQADPANTGNIYVGDVTVASTIAITLAPGQSITIGSDPTRGTGEEVILSDLYLDSSANSQSAHVFYLGRR